MVMPRAHEEGLNGAEGVFAHLAIRRQQRVPSAPQTAADHVQTFAVNLRHVLIPDVRVGPGQVEPGHVARHIGRADDRQRLAVELEIVRADRQLWT